MLLIFNVGGVICTGCGGPRRYIALGTDPVVCCVLVFGELWAACGGTIYQLDRKEMIGQVNHTSYK